MFMFHDLKDYIPYVDLQCIQSPSDISVHFVFQIPRK
jgi:hypothetical protein